MSPHDAFCSRRPPGLHSEFAIERSWVSNPNNALGRTPLSDRLTPELTRGRDSVPSCWFCEAVIAADDIHEFGYLSPRSADEGGPLWLFGCPSCGHDVGAERNAMGDFLLVPIERLGFAGRLACVFDREKLMLRAHARAWHRENAERRDAFHAIEAPRRNEETDHPTSARPKSRTSEAPPPPPRDEPRDPPQQPHHAEPSSFDEAYRRLGLDPTADQASVAEAFRELSKRCHPDKVAHLDADFQELAHRKFKALKDAYDELMGRFDG